MKLMNSLKKCDNFLGGFWETFIRISITKRLVTKQIKEFVIV